MYHSNIVQPYPPIKLTFFHQWIQHTNRKQHFIVVNSYQTCLTLSTSSLCVGHFKLQINADFVKENLLYWNRKASTDASGEALLSGTCSASCFVCRTYHCSNYSLAILSLMYSTYRFDARFTFLLFSFLSLYRYCHSSFQVDRSFAELSYGIGEEYRFNDTRLCGNGKAEKSKHVVGVHHLLPV